MARDHNERVWIGGGVIATLLLAGGLWSFVVSPQLDNVDSLKAQTADAQVQNLALQGNVSRLKAQYDHIADVKRELNAVHEQLPAQNALAQLTAQLSAQARAHHVSLTQYNAANPQPVAPPTATTAAAAAPASTAPAAVPATGASPASGLYAIQVSVIVTGKVPDELGFVRAVQKDGPRTALVTSTQLQSGSSTGGSGSGTGGSSLTLQMDVFVAPAAATPSAATPSAAPTAAG